jgi:NADH:ubiquinone oxidoreductase subunit 5 (subunit L)/multisubunit Na+/H+ antiporter MnhA subunit
MELANRFLLLAPVFAPFVVFLILGAGWLLGWEPRERTVARLTAATFFGAFLCVALLVRNFVIAGPVQVDLGAWFTAGDYEFPLTLLADRLSLPLLALTVVLSGVVGAFSFRYLHRDTGFLRFFVCLHLFAFGAALTFTAGSFDLLVAGWELVGLTSVILIQFFNQRSEPVRNSLRVFAVYKVTDIGLLGGVFLLHHFAGTDFTHALFHGQAAAADTVLHGAAATLVGLMFVLAAAGKSAQLPFSGWLPRAMEGPTPSSAIFYGAIAVHMGVYLLLRAGPILQASPYVPPIIVTLGLLTALHATLSGRAATDAKTLLSYAALAQVGVIFMEVGLGFERLAVVHILGHAAVRTLQFLRAPSMLHDDHRVHAAAGGHLAKTGAHYQTLLPSGVRSWLYRLALDRCHLDTLLERFVAAPFLASATRLAAFERGDRAAGSLEQAAPPIRPELVGGIDG